MTVSSSSITNDTPIPPASIVLFWLPLAATWFMMGCEGPYIAAIVARMPAAERSLAAFGVATALAWLIESPIMMLFSAATALVHGRASYLALRRFTNILNAVVTLAMVILSIPSVFRFVGETSIGLPAEISRLAHVGLCILIPWPAAIGYRRFYQGILVRHHLTRRVAYGTVVRLVSMSATAALLAISTSLPGATLGAFALLAGVVAEAIASRWMARHVVRSLMGSDEPAGSLLELSDIARFYYPLALTSVLSMALGPLVTFGLGRSRAPVESLAVWPVVTALVFLFRSGGVAFQEVGVALIGTRGEHDDEVRRTAVWVGAFASLALAVVALTPFEALWFERVSGLSHGLAGFAIWPVRILILLPVTEYLLSIQRARLILAHGTGRITVATAIETGGLAVALLVMIGAFDLVGALAGAIAMVIGRVAANVFLAMESPR
jgi:progressive ankylosis protein